MTRGLMSFYFQLTTSGRTSLLSRGTTAQITLMLFLLMWVLRSETHRDLNLKRHCNLKCLVSKDYWLNHLASDYRLFRATPTPGSILWQSGQWWVFLNIWWQWSLTNLCSPGEHLLWSLVPGVWSRLLRRGGPLQPQPRGQQCEWWHVTSSSALGVPREYFISLQCAKPHRTEACSSSQY